MAIERYENDSEIWARVLAVLDDIEAAASDCLIALLNMENEAADFDAAGNLISPYSERTFRRTFDENLFARLDAWRKKGARRA